MSTDISLPQADNLTLRPFLNIGSAAKNEKSEIAKAAKAAEEFESMYFSHIIKTLFAESEGNGLFGEGHGGELLKSIWINTMADAAHSSLGISKKIKETLMRRSTSSYKETNNQGGFYDLTI